MKRNRHINYFKFITHKKKRIRKKYHKKFVERFFTLLGKRVYPSLNAKELVGIEPLSAPTGVVFYLTRNTKGEV